MRFHVPGLAHTITNKTFINCAFTQKVFKLCKMLTSLGHEVFHYGCEGSNPECTEHVNVMSNELRTKFYPDLWQTKQWDFNVQDDCHKEFYKNTVNEIRKRLSKRDFFLASFGFGHKPIADVLGKEVLTVEPGIGYSDTFARYKVFESYNWMSYLYGRGFIEGSTRKTVENGIYFDAVIPNYFNPDDFEYTPNEKEDYFLYLGRIISRKGLDIIVETARTTGIHVKIAGQGTYTPLPQTAKGEIIEHVGFADIEKRKKLLSRAKGLLMPTVYIEPFGGVSIEAMISGTPVICTDWGVFPETIIHGITGYRCRTLDHFVWAVENIKNISPATCREYALKNFSLERVSQMYQEYFEMLYSLFDKGWYKSNPDRKNLNWLNKYYPSNSPIITSSNLIFTKNEILPEEGDKEYALNLDWYKKEKEPGISFILRAKNEEKTIGLALDSLNKIKIPYEVNIILNQCTDNTEREVNIRCQKNRNINVFYYPFQLGKTGLENICTPVTSVHSTIWLLNWAMMLGKYQYTFRWDADFIMTSTLSDELESLFKYDIINVPVTFADIGLGKENAEPYLWSNSLIPRYCRFSLWHLTRFIKNTEKIGTAKSKIIHDSSLNGKKEYWQTQPWWEIEGKKNDKYEELKRYIYPLDVHARANCPESELLARKIQSIIGIEDSEIEELKKYTESNPSF